MCYFVEKCVTIRLGDSMLPNKVIYKGKEFETIGFIKLNNGSFLILQNDEDTIYLDLNKLKLNLDLNFEIKDPTKVEIVLMDYIVEAIKNDIRNGKYQSKNDLKRDIVDLNKYINTHAEFLSNMKQLDFKDDVVNKTITSLLSYFDETIKDTPLNFDGITSFKVDGKDFIKYRDRDGHIKIMDDNVDNRNFIEQFKSKQNESKYFNLEDGNESALNIAEDMNKYQKTSVDLSEVGEIKEAPRSQVLPTITMQKYNDELDKRIVGNVESSVYYDEKDDKVLTAKQEGSKVVVSEVNEATTSSINEYGETILDEDKSIEYPPYDEEVVAEYLYTNKNNKIDKFVRHYLNYFTLNQINFILNNFSLDEELVMLLNERKDQFMKEMEQTKQKEKPKIKVLTLNNQSKAAFVDTLLLSFVVGLVSGMYLIILILMIMS